LIRLEVYNRSGVRVFMTADAERGWDGTFLGVPQSPGVYVWGVDYMDMFTGKRIHSHGTVVLVR
jgi:hypothetical protein